MLFLSSANYFTKSTFSKNSFRNITRASNSLDPNQAQHFVKMGKKTLRSYLYIMYIILSYSAGQRLTINSIYFTPSGELQCLDLQSLDPIYADKMLDLISTKMFDTEGNSKMVFLKEFCLKLSYSLEQNIQTTYTQTTKEHAKFTPMQILKTLLLYH